MTHLTFFFLLIFAYVSRSVGMNIGQEEKETKTQRRTEQTPNAFKKLVAPMTLHITIINRILVYSVFQVSKALQ